LSSVIPEVADSPLLSGSIFRRDQGSPQNRESSLRSAQSFGGRDNRLRLRRGCVPTVVRDLPDPVTRMLWLTAGQTACAKVRSKW
jgi:hypothetical protein